MFLCILHKHCWNRRGQHPGCTGRGKPGRRNVTYSDGKPTRPWISRHFFVFQIFSDASHCFTLLHGIQKTCPTFWATGLLGSNLEVWSGLKFARVETGMNSGWNYVRMDFCMNPWNQRAHDRRTFSNRLEYFMSWILRDWANLPCWRVKRFWRNGFDLTKKLKSDSRSLRHQGKKSIEVKIT